MNADEEGVIEALVTAVSLEDIETATFYFDPETRLTVFTPQEVVFDGPDGIRRRLQTLIGDFEIRRFTLRTVLPCDGGLRTQIDYSFRHRKSGESIDGVMRVIAAFRNGKIVRWEEYQDAERVEAFMRLVAHHK
ncbi:MAG: nuclear transport factor 2 family protein [Hyphomicrobiaceae bacterium]